MQYREGIGHVVVATKSEHQTSCSVEYGLKAPLEIGRKSDKHKVAVVEPGVDERDHEGAEAVVGDVATSMTKLPQCSESCHSSVQFSSCALNQHLQFCSLHMVVEGTVYSIKIGSACTLCSLVA